MVCSRPLPVRVKLPADSSHVAPPLSRLTHERVLTVPQPPNATMSLPRLPALRNVVIGTLFGGNF